VNILFINHYLPFPLDNGGHIATSSMIEMIAKEADVDLLMLGKHHHSEEKLAAARDHYLSFCKSFTYQFTPYVRPSYQKSKIAWHYLTGIPHQGDWSPKCLDILAEIVSAGKTDIIWAGHTKAGKYLRVGQSLKCKTVLSTHNVESDILKQRIQKGRHLERLRRWMLWRDMTHLEKQAVEQADVVTALTADDAAYYRKLKSNRAVYVLPFTLSEQYLQKYESATETAVESDLCFIGTMDWPPNEDAVGYLINEIMPLVWMHHPDVKVSLVGKNPTPRVMKLASKRVLVTGRVKSVHDYLAGAKIVVAPIRLGSGIKIKVLEAMLAGKPVVTTSMGAQGTGLQDNTHALVADRPRDFAQAIRSLIENEGKRSLLGRSAKAYIRSEFKAGQQIVNQILNQLD
jgi:glycosyltransferase involved in cell wall biosynthesis